MGFFITVLPWIAKAVLSSYFCPAIALSISLALALFFLWKDPYVIEWVTFLCFLVDVSLFFFCVDSSILSAISVLDTIVLMLASGFSVCVGKPLTLHYARAVTPSKFWDNVLFFRINNAMTAGLGVFFFLESIVKIVKILHPNFLPYVVLSCVFKAGLLAYISLFPKWYKERLLKASQVAIPTYN